MGKRKSAKPQKYVQQSDEEDEEHLELYDLETEVENNRDNVAPTTSEMNIRALCARDNLPNAPDDNLCKERLESMPFQASENVFCHNRFQLNVDKIVDNKYESQQYKLNKIGTPLSIHNMRANQNPIKQGHLDTLPENLFTPGSFTDERLSDGGHMSMLNMSGTESDRRSTHELDGDHRGLRPKRRRKYVTYPATFRLEVVEHAERNGKSAAAKKYNICVEKVSMWCKTKDNIVHKVKKGGFSLTDGGNDSYEEKMEEFPDTPVKIKEEVFDSQPNTVEVKEIVEEKRYQISKELEMLYNDDSDISEKYEAEFIRRQEIVFPPCFKLRVVQTAEEKGEHAAAKEYMVCEKRVHLWCQARDFICENAKKRIVEEWECDLYVTLKSRLEQNRSVTVRDLIVQAEQAQMANPAAVYSAITTTWLTNWCQKFNVRFNSPLDSIPQPLTEDACLMMETTLYQSDREEAQAVYTKGKKMNKIQDLIEDSKRMDASPSASDREDSFSFSSNNKRRRRSYTLAFKLEVVKFAQSHTKHATSRKYGIARRVISRWIADKEVLQNDLLHATQQVLGDSGINDDVDSELLKWYKDLKRRGISVSKSMLCAKAHSLFAVTGQNNASASNGWYRHWVLKWKERGENLEIVEDDEKEAVTPLVFHNNSMLSTTQSGLDATNSPNVQESSLNALKQACMTNAILNSLKPTSADLSLISHFPELMSAIQCNPSNASNALSIANQVAAAAANANLFQACSSSFQVVANYCKDQLAGNFNSTVAFRNHFLDNTSEDKRKGPHIKKRRERYSPDFKLTVIDYAASHSYQETSRKFGVHHITVSEWCKDKERIKRKVYCESLHSKILKSETAEQKFLSWLQDCNKQKIVIKPVDVQDKANEILNIIGEAEVKKNCWWFYLWNKRGLDSEKLFDDDADIDLLEKESRVNYPPAVKIEIAKVAERQSVNCAARCFRVARKRIREWVKTKDKLTWLAETGQVRERGGSLGGKKVNCLDADKEVYDWFKTCNPPETRPKSSEIRSKALEIFQKYGFNNMKCSREWYKSWCKRYGIRMNSEKDDALIKWALTRYDENLPVTDKELLQFVSSEVSQNKKASSTQILEDYGEAFCRRFPRLFDTLPTIGEIFPEEMEKDIAKFRQTIRELQEENNFSLLGVGCMDEIPISFSGDKVMVNRGMQSCDAIVIMSCLADGTLLPALIVLKEQEPSPVVMTDSFFVVYKERALVDESTIQLWLEKVWLSSVPSPSLLVMDCFKPHTSGALQDAMLESGVTPLVMPDGCASKLQPLSVSMVKNFQSWIEDTWNCFHRDRSLSKENSPSNSLVPPPVQIVPWITEAYGKLHHQGEIIRRSFLVTGIAVTSDGSEDAWVENMEWLGQSNDEHVLSPLSNDEDESESDT